MTTTIDPNDLLNFAREEINSAAKADDPAVDNDIDVEKKRKELLLLVGTDEMKRSESYLMKASTKVILRVYAEYEAVVQERNTIFLCDLLLSKFAMVLGGLDAIEKPDEMEAELQRDPMLKRDLRTAMSWLTPMIPFLGVLSGGLTVGKHVMSHKTKVGKTGKTGDGPADECAEQDD